MKHPQFKNLFFLIIFLVSNTLYSMQKYASAPSLNTTGLDASSKKASRRSLQAETELSPLYTEPGKVKTKNSLEEILEKLQAENCPELKEFAKSKITESITEISLVFKKRSDKGYLSIDLFGLACQISKREPTLIINAELSSPAQSASLDELAVAEIHHACIAKALYDELHNSIDQQERIGKEKIEEIEQVLDYSANSGAIRLMCSGLKNSRFDSNAYRNFGTLLHRKEIFPVLAILKAAQLTK